MVNLYLPVVATRKTLVDPGSDEEAMLLGGGLAGSPLARRVRLAPQRCDRVTAGFLILLNAA
jgi:hypothetical protein